MQMVISKSVVRCPSGIWMVSVLALPCRLCASPNFIMLQAPGRPTRLQCRCGWTAKLGLLGTWILSHTQAGVVPLGQVRRVDPRLLEGFEGAAVLDTQDPMCAFQQED